MNFSKKMGLGILASLAFAVVSTSVAGAATYDCYKTVVVKAGPNSGVEGDVAIQLQCTDATPAFGTIMVIPVAGMTDQALATALTAISLGKTVYVRTGGTVSGSALTIMYLNK